MKNKFIPQQRGRFLFCSPSALPTCRYWSRLRLGACCRAQPSRNLSTRCR